MFDDMDRKITMFFECAYVITNFGKKFNTHGMEEKANQFVDLTIYELEMCWPQYEPHQYYSRT
jgi:hypothetical protein